MHLHKLYLLKGTRVCEKTITTARVHAFSNTCEHDRYSKIYSSQSWLNAIANNWTGNSSSHSVCAFYHTRGNAITIICVPAFLHTCVHVIPYTCVCVFSSTRVYVYIQSCVLVYESTTDA